MAINKEVRVITEKITSVELPIEYVQTGTINIKIDGSTTLALPTTIKNVTALNIVPLDAVSANVILGGGTGNASQTGWWSDLKKYTASQASSLAHTVAADTNVDTDSIALRDSVLYQALRNMSASEAVSAVGTDSTKWERIPFFEHSSTATNFLIVNLRSSTRTAANLKIAYEVRGFNE